MEPLWQQVIIGGAILIAVGYLVTHFLRRRKAKGCPSCAAKQALLKRSPRPTTEHHTYD